MMYNQKMVACLKANGKVLREFKDTVYVPFGSEYSILIKNLNSLRAIVNIQIDGTDAVPGGLVVNANQEIDLERFVKDMNQGNKFKFIERSAAVEKGRGIKAEDGLVRISFKYAKSVPQNNILWGLNEKDKWFGARGQTYDSYHTPDFLNTTSISGSVGALNGSVRTISAQASSSTLSASASSALLSNDVGITVPGSLSEQKFVAISDFATETEEHVIVLRILGETENAPITAPITVKANQKCSVCAKVNKISAKFCTECGTNLTVY